MIYPDFEQIILKKEPNKKLTIKTFKDISLGYNEIEYKYSKFYKSHILAIKDKRLCKPNLVFSNEELSSELSEMASKEYAV